MGDGLIQNLLVICCLIASFRIALVVVYLTPDSCCTLQQTYQNGYTKTQNGVGAPNVRNIASNVSFEGFHDNAQGARAKIEIERQEAGLHGDASPDGGDDDMDVELVPAEVVSRNFDLMPAGGCPDGGKGVYLLVLVHSLPPHFDQRAAIRSTWARNASGVAGTNVKVLFLTPGVSPRPEVKERMKREAADYDDIVHSIAGDSTSTFRSSSKVLLSAMGWTTAYCSGAKFVLFAHDELFVNFPKVVARLKLVTPGSFRNFYLGRVKRLAKVARDPVQWDYVSEAVYQKETYPNYCVGGAGFVMSVPLIKQMHPRAVRFNSKTSGFPVSDVMLGIVAAELDVVPKYHEEFRKSGGEATYCDLRDTLTLGDFNTPSLMREVWKNHTDVTEYCPSPVPSAEDIEEWTKDVSNNHYFDEALKLILQPDDFCRENFSILALVSTHPNNNNLRSAIRVTWAQPQYASALKVRVLFVLGKPKYNSEDIRKESGKFGDILQANFRESFHNLTLKVILGLRWVSEHCPSAKFIYKGDDDMLVNFDHMAGYLNQLPVEESRNLFIGNLMTMSPAIRTPSKYQVRRDVYPFKFFLPYFSGGGYIMSAAALHKMSRMTGSTRLIPIDDAYAGILAFRAGIPLKHGGGGFIVGGSKRDACRLRRAFNMHGFKSPNALIGTWKTFSQVDHSCDEDKNEKNWAHIAQ